MDEIPHLALPLRITEDGYAHVQQDTLDELVVNVGVIVAFPIGSRIEAPEFGIPDLELNDLPLPTDALERTVETWEPRADVEITASDYDPRDPLSSRLTIAVTMPGDEDQEEV